MSASAGGEELLARMEALLSEWRPPGGTSEQQLEIPLLTDTLLDPGDEGAVPPARIPRGLKRELFQAHLAVAAEKVMQSLYRDLSTDLNDKIAEEMRRVVDQAIVRAVRGLRQQILVSVADSLTHSIEQLGSPESERPTDPPSKSRPP
jgi:hypothetical protein